MASIRKRGGKYVIRWREPGPGGRRVQRSKSFTKKTTAFDWLGQAQDAEERGIKLVDGRSQPAELCVVIAAYLAARARTLRQPTIDSMRKSVNQLGRWLGTKHKRVTIDLVDRAVLEAYWTHRIATVSPSTAVQNIRHIQRLWAWAWDHDVYGEHTERPRPIDLPRITPKATLAPTWDECDRAIDAAPSAWVRRLLLVMRFTGLRRRQAIGLLWDDLDLDASTLHVRPELGKSSREASGRWVPISQHLVDEIRTWPRPPSGELVRSPVPNLSNVTHRVAHAWERSGVRTVVWHGRPCHSFRKAFVTGLRRAGADPDAVEYLVGHSLGLTGLYLDPAGMSLAEAVELIPPVGGGVVVEMRRGEQG